MSLSDIKEWVVKHPYETAGAVFVGGAVLIYLYFSSSGPAPAATTTAGAATDNGAAYDAALAAQIQSEAQQGAQQTSLTALQDQLSGLQSSIAAQVSVASINAGTDVTLAQLNAQTAQDSINMYGGVQSLGILSNASIASQQIASQNYLASLSAFTATTADYFSTTEAINQTNAELAQNLGDADLTNQTEQNIVTTLAGKIH